MGYVHLNPIGVDPHSVGKPCPEAATWPNLWAHVRCGAVALVQDGGEARFRRALADGDIQAAQALAPTTLEHLIHRASRYLQGGAEASATVSHPPPSGDSAPPAVTESGEASADAKQKRPAIRKVGGRRKKDG